MSTFAAGSSSSSAKIAHSPSAVEEDSVDRILRSAYDAQYLRASKELALLEDLMNPQNEFYCGDAESHRLRLKLDLYSSAIKQIKDRASKVLHTLQQELSIRTGGSDWIYGTKHFGITTYYQVAEDGCITVRMEGGLDNLPFFEQAAVIHDIDSFKHWVPFCEDSRMLEKLGPAELFMYVCLKVPFAVSRDACVHAYAADCLHENGKILLLGNSVEHEIGEVKGMSERGSGHERSLWEWQWERQEQERLQRIHQEGIEGAAESPSVPPPHVLPRSTTIYDNNSILRKVISHCPESACPWMTYGWGSSRMTISEYIAIIEVTGPESARPVIIAKVDPNMGRFIPQWLLNSLIKNLAGVLLHYFQKQVQNVAAFNQLNPTTQAKTKKSDIQTLGTASPESLAKHRAFYCDWLVPKLRTYGRYMNWTLQDIACLGIDGRMSLEDSPIDKNDTKVTHDVTDVHVSTEGTSEGDVKMPIPSAT